MGNDNLAKGNIDGGVTGSVEEVEGTQMGLTSQGWVSQRVMGSLRMGLGDSGARRASRWSFYWVRKGNCVKRVSRNWARVAQNSVLLSPSFYLSAAFSRDPTPSPAPSPSPTPSSSPSPSPSTSLGKGPATSSNLGVSKYVARASLSLPNSARCLRDEGLYYTERASSPSPAFLAPALL